MATIGKLVSPIVVPEKSWRRFNEGMERSREAVARFVASMPRTVMVTPDDAHHAMILAENLEQQGCKADAELVRRLAVLTPSIASPR